jgi:phage FluMu protein Com
MITRNAKKPIKQVIAEQSAESGQLLLIPNIVSVCADIVAAGQWGSLGEDKRVIRDNWTVEQCQKLLVEFIQTGKLPVFCPSCGEIDPKFDRHEDSEFCWEDNQPGVFHIHCRCCGEEP